ncbi:MAG: hypothetical protein EZS28_023503 [Streblomastix strix]|uniref:Uncharacterized protein n=1 Tax=Streblomastix strix TaxID=222440 RepID=A0A5J4VEE0_9EUKA|nr:MAG: hypothetical protein EZS28_023503 [Streblomastix strix]
MQLFYIVRQVSEEEVVQLKLNDKVKQLPSESDEEKKFYYQFYPSSVLTKRKERSSPPSSSNTALQSDIRIHDPKIHQSEQDRQLPYEYDEQQQKDVFLFDSYPELDDQTFQVCAFQKYVENNLVASLSFTPEIVYGEQVGDNNQTGEQDNNKYQTSDKMLNVLKLLIIIQHKLYSRKTLQDQFNINENNIEQTNGYQPVTFFFPSAIFHILMNNSQLFIERRSGHILNTNRFLFPPLYQSKLSTFGFTEYLSRPMVINIPPPSFILPQGQPSSNIPPPSFILPQGQTKTPSNIPPPSFILPQTQEIDTIHPPPSILPQPSSNIAPPQSILQQGQQFTNILPPLFILPQTQETDTIHPPPVLLNQANPNYQQNYATNGQMQGQTQSQWPLPLQGPSSSQAQSQQNGQANNVNTVAAYNPAIPQSQQPPQFQSALPQQFTGQNSGIPSNTHQIQSNTLLQPPHPSAPSIAPQQGGLNQGTRQQQFGFNPLLAPPQGASNPPQPQQQGGQNTGAQQNQGTQGNPLNTWILPGGGLQK